MRDGTSAVTGVLTADGPLVYDHYVVSPGAGNEALRRQIPSLRQVHGVLGCWATVPNVTPALGHSLKVARRGHVAEDANITVGRDDSGESVLMIGSGYGWTGCDPRNIDERKIEDIHAAVADTVETLFPDAYEKIGGRDGLRRTQRHCVRPWTASNLGIFEASAAMRRGLRRHRRAQHGRLRPGARHRRGGLPRPARRRPPHAHPLPPAPDLPRSPRDGRTRRDHPLSRSQEGRCSVARTTCPPGAVPGHRTVVDRLRDGPSCSRGGAARSGSVPPRTIPAPVRRRRTYLTSTRSTRRPRTSVRPTRCCRSWRTRPAGRRPGRGP